MATLFQIGDTGRAIMDLVDESPSEMDPILDGWVKEFETEESEKLTAYWSVMRQLEMEAATATAEAEQFQAKARARENAVKRMKDRLKTYLELTGRREAVASNGKKFAIQANGGKVPLVMADGIDPDAVPREYQKVRIEFDTDAIRRVLEDGDELSFASLGSRGTHLRVS